MNMKTACAIFALLALVVGADSPARSQDPVWRKVTLPANDPLQESMCFVSKDHGWSVGVRGLIFETRDAGKTWVKQREHSGELLNCVFFADERTGWAVGGRLPNHGGDGFPGIALKTEDGGSSWGPVTGLVQKPESEELWHVSFSGKAGWIWGHPNSFATQDAGKTWNRLNPDPVTAKPWSPSFVSEKVGFEIRANKLYSTRDGGRSWVLADLAEFLPRGGEVSSEYFIGERNAFAVGRVETETGWDALVIKTGDSGSTWTVASRLADKGTVRGAVVVDGQSAWIVTAPKHERVNWVLHTDDGGRSWIPELEHAIEAEGGTIDSLFFSDKRTGFIPGPGWLYRRE